MDKSNIIVNGPFSFRLARGHHKSREVCATFTARSSTNFKLQTAQLKLGGSRPTSIKIEYMELPLKSSFLCDFFNLKNNLQKMI